jgi:hypothetical protein
MPNLCPVPGDKHRLRFRDRPEGEVVDVELFYTKGSSPRSRGVYLAVRPVTVEEHFESCILLAGYRARVRTLERASPTMLKHLAEAADTHVAQLAKAYREDPEAARAAFDELATTLAAA